MYIVSASHVSMAWIDYSLLPDLAAEQRLLKESYLTPNHPQQQQTTNMYPLHYDNGDNEDNKRSINTFIRLKPINNIDHKSKLFVVNDTNPNMMIDINKNKRYSVNKILNENTNNDECFKIFCASQININLYQDQLFIVYGQTNTGKTFTILGNDENEGCLIQTMKYVLNTNNKLSISAKEIYSQCWRGASIKCFDILTNRELSKYKTASFKDINSVSDIDEHIKVLLFCYDMI